MQITAGDTLATDEKLAGHSDWNRAEIRIEDINGGIRDWSADGRRLVRPAHGPRRVGGRFRGTVKIVHLPDVRTGIQGVDQRRAQRLAC